MEEQTLELKLVSKAEEGIKQLDRLVKILTNVDNSVSSICKKLETETGIKKTTNEIDKLSNKVEKAEKKFIGLGKAINLGVLYMGVRKASSFALNWMDKSIDYTEALNLFNVVLDESSKKGMKFQNIMNEAFGTNQTQTLTYQGLYQSMAENMEIAQKYAYTMSETTTKLINDISSLYNKSEDKVSEALRAGVFAGQTKPLRSYGMDVTEKSLQPVLDEIGVKNADGTAKTVRELNQAEKQILRYIAVLKQSSVAHKDWANTIESPSNQLKIFKNQAIEAQRAFMNLFMGSFAKILPYANAILMVIKEVSKAIATMFGIEITDYNTSIGDMSGAFEDVEDSVDDATGSIKKMKQSLTSMSFDNLHNISTPTDISGSTSGTVSGGIDQKLLDSITSYDNGMESVRMKATQIRDRIMEWLGFTKEIDPLTGNVSFKLKDGYSNLKMIGGVVAGLVGLKLGSKLLNVASGLALMKTNSAGLNKILQGGKGTIGLMKQLYDYSKLYTTLSGGKLLTGIKAGTKAWATHNSKLLTTSGLIAMIVAGWSSFIKQYKNISSFNSTVNGMISSLKSLSNSLLPILDLLSVFGTRIGKLFDSLVTVIDSGVNNFVNSIAFPINMLSDLLEGDFKGMLDSSGKFIENWAGNLKNTLVSFANTLPFVHIETEAEKMEKKLKEVEESLFKNGGTSIIAYKESLDSLLSSISNGIPNVDKYNQIIAENDEKYKNANDSLGILLTQMSTDAYKVSADDISKLNGLLEEMETSVKASGQAFTDATTSIVNHLVEEGRISQEQALIIIRNAQEKAEAEGNSAEVYRLKMLELTAQLEKGIITQEQFNVSQMEYAKELNKTTEIVDTAKISVQNYVDYINGKDLIQTKSWNELNDSIEKIGDSYTKNKKISEDAFESQREIFEQNQLFAKKRLDTQKKLVDDLKDRMGVESQEYQKAQLVLEDYQKKYDATTNAIFQNNDSQQSSIKELKTTMVEALLGITTNLKDETGKMKVGTDETVKKINSIFKTMGLDVDITQNIDDIKKQLKESGIEIPDTVVAANKEFEKLGKGVELDTSDLEKQATNAGKKVSDLFGSNFNKTFTMTANLNSAPLYSQWNRTMNTLSSKASQSNGLIMNDPFRNMTIRGYASGKYDIPEDGWFRASKGELMGRFDDGTSVIANNQQITNGIKQAVMEGMSAVMSRYGGMTSRVEVISRPEKGTIMEVVSDGLTQYVEQNGDLPFPIPY